MLFHERVRLVRSHQRGFKVFYRSSLKKKNAISFYSRFACRLLPLSLFTATSNAASIPGSRSSLETRLPFKLCVKGLFMMASSDYYYQNSFRFPFQIQIL